MGANILFELSITTPYKRNGAIGLSAQASIKARNNKEICSDPIPIRLPEKKLSELIFQNNFEEYSNVLSSAVFVPDLKIFFSIAHTKSTDFGLPLEFQLRINSSTPEYQKIIWERLRDPQNNTLLSLNENVYFSRYYPTAVDRHYSPVKKKINDLEMLVAASNPADIKIFKLDPIPFEKDFSMIKQSISGAKVIFLPDPQNNQEPCSLNNIRGKISLNSSNGAFDILYLICHGGTSAAQYSSTGAKKDKYCLFLQDDQGNCERVKSKVIVEEFKSITSVPRLIVLSACSSAGDGSIDATMTLAAQLVEAGIPAVIAMQGPISFKTTQEFMGTFFNELTAHGKIDRAVQIARRKVKDNQDWYMPVLFMNIQDGQLWIPGGAAEPNIPAQGPEDAVSADGIPGKEQRANHPPVQNLPAEKQINPGQNIGQSNHLRILRNQLPHPPQIFIGREYEQKKIKEFIHSGEKIIYITGVDGAGKSALASVVACDPGVSRQYPDGLLFFDSFGNRSNSSFSWEDIMLQTYKYICPSTIIDFQTGELEKEFLRIITTRKLLFVLDNSSQFPLPEKLPPQHNCLFLIISAEPLENQNNRPNVIQVAGLSKIEALDLFKALNTTITPQVEQFVEASAGLPLLIRMAAEMLKNFPGIDLSTLLN